MPNTVAGKYEAMSKRLATEIHATGYDENLDPWLHLDKFKVTCEDEIEFRTHIENLGRKKVIHHTNETTLARMKKEIKRRLKID